MVSYYKNKYKKLENLVIILDIAFREWKLPEKEIHNIFNKLRGLTRKR